MARRSASLSDKFDLSAPRQLLNGAQAIVRLVLMQKARDAKAGHATAGYVTGYRGSPIAGLESQFERARALTEAADIRYQPAVNEDLAATALWGAQQAELRGEGRYAGVFGIWYGKGPGVDRSGDAFRHANHAGTSPLGGVLALMGDDHTCESSTSAHQSEFAFVDAMMPILNPAGVQEILDYGLHGFAVSRYAGVWVGLKCVKDNMEATATVDGRLDRVQSRLPSSSEMPMPAGGLNIRLHDGALAKEARLHEHRLAAAQAYVRANGLDRLVFSGGATPRLGIVTTGKSYLDTRQALDELGIDAARADALGLRLYKVAMTWPLEPRGLEAFADGLDTILVVEEKRALMEGQIKELLYNRPRRPAVIGKRDESGAWLLSPKGALDPLDIALAIARRLPEDTEIGARRAVLEQARSSRVAKDTFTRIPYFCAGCPHNRSTVVPEGARAYAGIGCHYMAQWMDRATEGFTQMGGEGANWVGEAPFSRRRHVFQNMGDGTYIHSGALAIRAAIATRTTMTFKILYNDAVAMTGGQSLEGGITVPQIAAQVLAEGASRVDVVTDDPSRYRQGELPRAVGLHHRRDLDAVQRQLALTEGTSVLIYDQTCAAEKRRRRKRGLLPEPDRRVVVNPLVCEGCGDCGRVSNCIAVLPLETEYGRKRQIDQSACNKDFSCIEGFCPSFVTVHGATLRKSERVVSLHGAAGIAAELPAPELPPLDRPYAILVTGVGGTGVVTLSAVLAQAAHLDGKGFGSIDVTGLAQKGGAVACHMRVASSSEDIHAIRVGVAHADLLLGGDLVVTAAARILETVRRDVTAVVHSSYEMTTGDFTRDPDLEVPGARLARAIEERVGRGPLFSLDAHTLCERLFGDTMPANMLLLGAAYQLGHVPISAASIEEAIALNGAQVEMNTAAFTLGRLAVHDPARFAALTPLAPAPIGGAPAVDLDTLIDRRADELSHYQDAALAARYRRRVSAIRELERHRTPGLSGLAEAVAKSYFKVLAYKDEYEVARLYTDGRFAATLASQLEGVRGYEIHLAPPWLGSGEAASGSVRKIRLRSWMLPLLRLLAKGKALRGTPFDPFGYQSERRLERALVARYEDHLDRIALTLARQNHAAAVELAAQPLAVRGFGHVKRASLDAIAAREAELLGALST